MADLRDGFREIVTGWTLVDDFGDLTDRIERAAEWAKENGPLRPDEEATVKLMIETQIVRGVRRGDFEPYIGGGDRMGRVPLHVAVIDIGRKENTGWAIDGPRPSQGKIIDECVDALAVALDEGALALGFEAPMFVPLHQDADNLTRWRNGEHDRAFTAGAGSAVLVSGLVVVPYVLKRLRERAARQPRRSIGRHP